MNTVDLQALFDAQYQASRAQVDVPLLVRRERLLRMRKLLDENGPVLAAGVHPDGVEVDLDRLIQPKVEAEVKDRQQSAAPSPDKLTLSKGGMTAQKGAGAEDKLAQARAKQDEAARVAELNRNLEELRRMREKAAADKAAADKLAAEKAAADKLAADKAAAEKAAAEKAAADKLAAEKAEAERLAAEKAAADKAAGSSRAPSAASSATPTPTAAGAWPGSRPACSP